MAQNNLANGENKPKCLSETTFGKATKPSLLTNMGFLRRFSFMKDTNGELKPSVESIMETRELIYDEKDLQETMCGIGPFRPKWLQTLAKKEAYILVFCLVGLIMGMFFTYTVSIISTIEKRFKLTSKQTGTMLAGNDISQVILAIVLGYYGNYGHRPQWLGFGMMCAAISCFIAAVPHFVYGPGQDAIDIVESTSGSLTRLVSNATSVMTKGKEVEVCFSGTEESCGDDDSVLGSYTGPVILFFVSQFFVGIAISLFYSIGITYMDDNVSKKTYPFYYSLALLLRILGPVLGFLVGGKCLSLWIDPSESPNLTRKDPRWLGAWWLGYLFIGCGLVLVSSLMFLFPRKLPGTLTRVAKKVLRQANKDEREGSNRGVEYFASLAKTKKLHDKPSLANLMKALKRLFTNKVWVGYVFNTIFAVLAFSGYWNFKPKYLENQFRKSAAEASYYTGMASFTSVVLGTGIGGAVLRWIRPRPRYVASYVLFVTLVQAAGFLSLMFIGCAKLNVVGPVDGSERPECSADCGCSDKFAPMCSQDQTTVFYSACHAGCTHVNTSVSPIVFSGCRCISNTSAPPSDTLTPPASATVLPENGDGFGYGTSGYCPEPCDTFYYYLIIQIIIKTISSTSRAGSSLLHIRSVADEDKGLALGALTVFISFFGFIPAPIIMGAIIDSSCLLWEKSCGVFGNCWLYDSDKFRIIIHLVPAALTLVSVIGDIVVLCYSHQLDLYGEKEEDIEMDTTEGKTEESKLLNSQKDEDCVEPK